MSVTVPLIEFGVLWTCTLATELVVRLSGKAAAPDNTGGLKLNGMRNAAISVAS